MEGELSSTSIVDEGAGCRIHRAILYRAIGPHNRLQQFCSRLNTTPGRLIKKFQQAKWWGQGTS